MNIVAYIFGGTFFFAGAFFLNIYVVDPLGDAWQVQSWKLVKGQLITADLRTNHVGNSSEHKVVAKYEYKVKDRLYEGDRVSIYTGVSGNHDKTTQLLKRLQKEQQSNNGIAVWYDKRQPHRSIYDRSVNWRMIFMMGAFCSAFMWTGAGFVGFFFSKRHDDIPLGDVRSREPWASYKAWASPVIYSRSKGSVKASWFFAVLTILIYLTFILGAFGRHPVATVISMLFVIVPILVVMRAIHIQLGWNRFRQVPLKMNPYPGSIGGGVGGELVIPADIQDGDRYELTLQCIKHWTSRSMDEVDHHQHAVWSKEQTVMSKKHMTGSLISFLFDVPKDQPSSSKLEGLYYEWLLSVKGDVNGVDFDRVYEIPVFVTSNSKRGRRRD